MPTVTPTIAEPVFYDRDTINALYARYGLMPMSGGDGTDEPLADDDAADEEDGDEGDLPADLGDKGKEALKAERKRKAEAIKRAKAAEAELATLRAEKAEADRLKKEQADALALENGEFKQVAEQRGEELKTVTGERDDLKTRLDKLTAALKPDLDAKWAELPAEIADLYDGDADDVIARQEFLTSPRITKLVTALAGKEEATRKRFTVTGTPNPDRGVNPNAEADDTARKQFASQYTG